MCSYNDKRRRLSTIGTFPIDRRRKRTTVRTTTTTTTITTSSLNSILLGTTIILLIMSLMEIFCLTSSSLIYVTSAFQIGRYSPPSSVVITTHSIRSIRRQHRRIHQPKQRLFVAAGINGVQQDDDSVSNLNSCDGIDNRIESFAAAAAVPSTVTTIVSEAKPKEVEGDSITMVIEENGVGFAIVNGGKDVMLVSQNENGITDSNADDENGLPSQQQKQQSQLLQQSLSSNTGVAIALAAVAPTSVSTSSIAVNSLDTSRTLTTSSSISTTTATDNYRLVLYDLTRAGLLGIITGVSVAVFKESIQTIRLESYSFPFLVEPIVAALVPAFGGLLVGLLSIAGKFPPGLSGIIKDADNDTRELFSISDDDDNDTEMTSTSTDYNSNNSIIPKTKFSSWDAVRKTLAAICTLGTGNSLGPEGPSVEIGVNLSRQLTIAMNQIPTDNFSEILKHNRLLLSCGGAAGVAAGFNAPIAGIFFALEVIQGSFTSISTSDSKSADGTDNNNIESQNLISTKGGISSIVLSSVLAALVAGTLLGDELAFKVAQYSLKTPLLELPLYLLLGALSGLLAYSFSVLNKSSKEFFDGKLGPDVVRSTMENIPSVFKPVIGGLFCGFVGITYPQILFFGYETLNNLLAKTSLSTELLLSLLGIKMITTSIASGSGLVGGLFAPSLFFGGMLGASFHNIAEYILSMDGVIGLADVPAYAMIGSASVLAALFRAPLTASLLLFECTREYEILLPLMASAGLASVVADVLELRSSSSSSSSNTAPTTATGIPVVTNTDKKQ